MVHNLKVKYALEGEEANCSRVESLLYGMVENIAIGCLKKIWV
jgi:hypothetical protein